MVAVMGGCTVGNPDGPSRARNPAWLMALSGLASESPAGRSWCCLCLTTGDEAIEGATACATDSHWFCSLCFEDCGGSLLSQPWRCPLCRLSSKAGGFDKLVAHSASAPFDSFGTWKDHGCLIRQETFGEEERCEFAAALAADRAKELRRLMRTSNTKSESDSHEASDIAQLIRELKHRLPRLQDLPTEMWEDVAVVSNSSYLLGQSLGSCIDTHTAVVRFNEYAKAGLDRFEDSVGGRTTCHVLSEQVAQTSLQEPKMREALKKTPLTIWMPPMAWGNSMYYSRYARLLLGDGMDGLGLTQQERRKVVILRPGLSFAMWRYFGSSQCPSAGTTGFKFALLAMGLSRRVSLYGFEDDDGNSVDKTGGHYFDKNHTQEQSYDFSWERQRLRHLEATECLQLVPSHRQCLYV
mmetsp:Transcript_23738/g.65877  ORF Transcript_23738/g.65877 Transcript_23738/m.65877 type:complete len:410 (+) Transcript_23738:116-1345(+)